MSKSASGKDYTVIRSHRRTVSAEVSRAGVIVRAPEMASDAEIDRFVSEKRGWIDEKLQKISETPLSPMERCFSPKEEAQLRADAKAKLPSIVKRYSGISGLIPSGIRITGAKTRFGSCSGKNSLSFSWRLMLYPDEAIEYVVVHELCHIVHKNHSAAFYSLVARIMPDWQNRREMLRRSP